MPFAKSWKRHETAAAYQATRLHLDNLSYQPPAPELAARWAERFPGGKALLPIHEEGRRSPRGERERTPPDIHALEHLFHGNNRECRRVCSQCTEPQGLPGKYARGRGAHLRQLRVRHPRPRPNLRVLRREGDRPRCGGGWPLLLLRPLREHGRSRRGRRQGVGTSDKPSVLGGQDRRVSPETPGRLGCASTHYWTKTAASWT